MGEKLRRLHRGWLVLLGLFAVVLALSFQIPGDSGSAAAQQLTPTATPSSTPDATALLVDANGRTLANVELRQRNRDVMVRLVLTDSPRLTGSHALQIHASATCTAPDFASAGALFNANSRLPNINYGVGLTTYQTTLIGASVVRGAANSLVGGYGPASGSGTSIVLFDKPDDGKAPSDARLGDRIGCGVIRAAQPGTSGAPTATSGTLGFQPLLAAAQPVPGAAAAGSTTTRTATATTVATATPTRATLTTTPTATPTRTSNLTSTSSQSTVSPLNSPGATAELKDRSGHTLANAEFRQFGRDVLVQLTFADPPRLTGTHALQVHAVASCNLPDFASAGPIFKPANKLPNINYTTGLKTYQSSITGASLLRGVPNSLIGTYGPNSTGTSLVLFDKPDDGKTQPEGNAGDRIGCGVIRTAQPSATGSATATVAPAQGASAPVRGVVVAPPVVSRPAAQPATAPTATPTRPAGTITATPTPTRPAGTLTATPTRSVANAAAAVSATATPTRAAVTGAAVTATSTPVRAVVAGPATVATATPTRAAVTGAAAVIASATPTRAPVTGAAVTGGAVTASATPTRLPATATPAPATNAQTSRQPLAASSAVVASRAADQTPWLVGAFGVLLIAVGYAVPRLRRSRAR
jgi:Cu/Zn superoxide dismutase